MIITTEGKLEKGMSLKTMNRLLWLSSRLRMLRQLKMLKKLKKPFPLSSDQAQRVLNAVLEEDFKALQ